MWLTRDTLLNGAASGHYFENYVVIELLKTYRYGKSKANLSYTPNRNEVKKYELYYDKASIPRGCGGLVCMCDKPIPIDEKNSFIPSN